MQDYTLLRDISLIPNDSCLIIPDDKSIISRTDTTLTTFKLVSNKYELSQTTPNDNSYSSYSCHTREYVGKMASPYDFVTPFFLLAIALVIMFIIFSAYYIILHPFFRSKF